MKLTPEQINSLIVNAKIGLTIRKILSNKLRLKYHFAPVKEGIEEEAYLEALQVWKAKVKSFDSFAKNNFDKAAKAESLERIMFIQSIASFDYTGISKLSGEYLLDQMLPQEVQGVNIFSKVIDQMYDKVMLLNG